MGTRRENGLVPADQLLDVDIGAEAIRARLERIDEPHLAPLTQWVRERRDDPQLPPDAGRTIPWMDPDSGGIDSRILLLLQDPSATATGTKFISPDNNDPTARCTTEACAAGGIDRSIRLHWNVYPYWVNTRKDGVPRDPRRPLDTWANASRVAAQLWGGFFNLFTDLRVIATFGVQAEVGWRDAVKAGLEVPSGVHVEHGPSLSPPRYNSVRQEAADMIRDLVQLAGR